jgi:hypothetical protein
LGSDPFSARFTSVESWPTHLDDDFIKLLSAMPNREAEAIAAIQASHPEIDEDLIWARIVYLGLTQRTRRPYKRHPWTKFENEILKREYGRSKAASQGAIEKILALHPDWSRDAIVCRARALGLTQRRQRAHQVWTRALDHLLLSMRGCQADSIAKRLGRTKESVLGRLRRLGWGADFFGGFKTKDLFAICAYQKPQFNAGFVMAGFSGRGDVLPRNPCAGCASTTPRRYRSRRSLLKHRTGWCNSGLQA